MYEACGVHWDAKARLPRNIEKYCISLGGSVGPCIKKPRKAKTPSNIPFHIELETFYSPLSKKPLWILEVGGQRTPVGSLVCGLGFLVAILAGNGMERSRKMLLEGERQRPHNLGDFRIVFWHVRLIIRINRLINVILS